MIRPAPPKKLGPDPYTRVSPIRDVIHNYLTFSVFERDVIDSRYFQRLHFVLQNSAAYAAYPSNKNSQFVHSLGVSHLCGRLFVHGLKNSHQDVLAPFLKDADKFLARHIDFIQDREGTTADIQHSWRDLIGNSARFLHNPPDTSPLDISTLSLKLNPDFVVNTIWLALRICGLSHDIGHLPMSHSFEHAIKDIDNVCYSLGINKSHPDLYKSISAHKTPISSDALSPERTDPAGTLSRLAAIFEVTTEEIEEGLSSLAIHERRSLRILDEIRRSPVNYYKPRDDLYRDLLFSLSQVILLSSKNISFRSNIFLAAIRDIVASGLDADRLDYAIRDPRASGLELGAFDLDRIVTNFTLCRADGRYQFAFADNCVSAIESFFHQRYLLYTTLVYHRTAVRAKAVLRELIARLIIYAYRNPDNRISSVLAEAGIVELQHQREDHRLVSALLPASKRNLWRLDDARLRTLLFDVSEFIAGRTDTERSENRNELGMIGLLADTFIFRQRENLISFGKGTISAHGTMKELGINDVNPFNIGDGEAKNQFRELISKHRKQLIEEYDGKVCLIVSELPPKTYKAGDRSESKVYVTTRGRDNAVPIENVSAFLAEQENIEKRDMDFSISFVARNIRFNKVRGNDNRPTDDDNEVKVRVSDIYKELIQSIAVIKRALIIAPGTTQASQEVP